MALVLRFHTPWVDSGPSAVSAPLRRRVAGAFDRTTLCMAHDYYQLGTSQLGREFKTAEDIVIDKITCRARHKKITDAPVEPNLRRNARVESTHHRGEGELTSGGLFDLGEEVPLYGFTANKAFIALFEHLQRLGWGDSGPCFLGECGACC